MKNEEIHYLCLLGNVDESILKLNNILDYGFEINEIDIIDKKFKYIQKIERLKDTAGICNRLKNDYHCMNYTKVYGIENSFNTTIDGSLVIYEEFDRILVDDYVNSLVKKLRLFKEGNLRVTVAYQFFKSKNGNVESKFTQRWKISELGWFKLVDSELPKLMEFMKDFEIPFDFEQPFLRNAFELFELSYYTFNYEIKALLLFMSMEVLFKSDKDCRAQCISENISAFFGNDKTDIKDLYCKMRKFWDIRNNIAHEGISKLNQNKLQNLIKELRKYVRDSIVKIDNLNQNKDEILNELNLISKIKCNE